MSRGFIFAETKTVITYDLTDNDVSAAEIAEHSDNLYAKFYVGNIMYKLPTTTLFSNIATAAQAEEEFRQALAKTGSDAEISRLLVVEVYDKSGRIEDNE